MKALLIDSKRSRFGSVCCSVDPVDRTRELRSKDRDMCAEQDREMGFCEFNQIRLICERTISAYLTGFRAKILTVVSHSMRKCYC